MARPSRALFLALAASVAGTACHHKPAVAPTPAVNQDSINAANAARARQDSINAAGAARARDSVNAANAARARADSIAAAARAAMEAARTTLTTPVYFDYDKSDLTTDDRSALDAKVPVFTANAGLQVRIEGNTDSRGSEEYNLALGQRRAAAAKRYLVAHGVADARLSTKSNGMENPAVQGNDESAWSKNRRDEFVPTAGADSLRAGTP